MKWWLNEQIRMIQNNLQLDSPGKIDPKTHVARLKEMHANVLQLNCGGIWSFYPTGKDYQIESPYLRDDFFGRMTEECHRNGIRVIARFDFSKLPDTLEQKYPDWWATNRDGSYVRYNGTIATCVNSRYQQLLSSEIIADVIRRYRIDGVFFNWFGYVNMDYEGNVFGPCQCENCRRKFREMFGEDLPEDFQGLPELQEKYKEFKKRTVREILQRIRNTVEALSDDIAISTYVTEGVDIVRDESNTDPKKPLPYWPYMSSDNVTLIADSYPDKRSSNVSINALSLSHRYSSIDRAWTRIRLYQNLAAGGALDFCILGGFTDYPDKKNLPDAASVFAFAERYQEIFSGLKRTAQIAVLASYGTRKSHAAYRGLFRMLKEEHLLFCVLEPEAVRKNPSLLEGKKLVFFTGEGLDLLPLVEKKGGAAVFIDDGSASVGKSADLIASAFGITALSEELRPSNGSFYFRAAPAPAFQRLQEEGTNWIALLSARRKFRLLPGAKGMLPLVLPSTFGPPELAFGNKESDTPLAAAFGKNLYIGFDLSGQYDRVGQESVREAFLSAVSSVSGLPRELLTDAPEMCEFFLNETQNSGEYLLQIINLTGYNGVRFFSAPKLSGIRVQLPGKMFRRIRRLGLSSEEELQPENGAAVLDLDGEYAAFLLEC